MATMTIRKLDESVKRKLRIRAARRGHSMEAEARAILTRGVEDGLESADGRRPHTEEPQSGPFDGLVGIWKDRMTTDELMDLTRGEL